MDRPCTTEISLRLYQYLCDCLGTEDAVRVRRAYYAAVDYYHERKSMTIISSGSKAEGLCMAGSDLDIMYVHNSVHISQKRSTDAFWTRNNFVMDTGDTKPGFTQLKFFSYCLNSNFFDWCIWQEGELRLSSEKIKTWHLAFHAETRIENPLLKSIEKIHGPCISETRDLYDHAYCVHCNEWIEQAQSWVTRSRQWPSLELVSRITSYGVLFVPIGCRGSPSEKFEWRISFSVAEKHLIFSFSHTQLLCYAMLKLLLKEVIDKRANFKGLLCSYFLKTIMFWVSEEFSVSVWRPENMFSCFSDCFKRLIYCITYEFLPHYFITENNLFENRFNTRQHLELLNFLSDQYNKGINCLTTSKTMSDFYCCCHPVVLNLSDIDVISTKINTLVTDIWPHHYGMYTIAVPMATLLFRRSKLKSSAFVPSITFNRLCQINSKSSVEDSECKNKSMYHILRQNISYLMLGVHVDDVCGWLYLATYYYCRKQFKTSLQIINHALTNCTPDKTVAGCIFTPACIDTTEREGLQLDQLTIRDIFRRKITDHLYFNIFDNVIPQELKPGSVLITPVVYAHFLSFLCWYHLQDNVKCRQALHNVRLTIQERYYMQDLYDLTQAYTCLGIGRSMLGEKTQG